MNHFVLDASLALSWAIDDPEPTGAKEIRESLFRGRTAIVPSLWVLEVASGLILAERRGRVDAAEVEQACQLYEKMMGSYIEVHADHPQADFRDLQGLARKHQITAYDAAYLFLALQSHIPLATLDSSLASAAKNSGVAVLP